MTARREPPPSADYRRSQLIIGQLEAIDDAGIRGWAIDRRDPQSPLQLRVLVDGGIVALLTCEIARPDLAALRLPALMIGFDYRIPARFRDGTRHTLSLASLTGEAVWLPDATNRLRGEVHFCIGSIAGIQGVLDGLVDGMVQGWALKSSAGVMSGGVRVLLSVDGRPVADVVADQFRGDLGEIAGADSCCGFSWALPDQFWGSQIRLEAHAMPARLPLLGSPVRLRLPAAPERGQIVALMERADELFRFAYRLRRDLRALLPAERLSLADYPAWAAQNQARIAARAAIRYGPIAGEPLVSILCPVYRPVIGDFLAAIDSVRAQTYRHWELLLVDDASEDAELTAAIARLAAADPRIRALAMARNGGISAATNCALDAARGEVIALFDHDDLLDASALEVMLRARCRTGAQLLYSDEDKVNSSGRFCEPNLKPDFNYRFLLENNYICHLLLVETALARASGGFDPDHDGAQDHDFLLRLVETMPWDAIHHVPEILYHWRISERSTAGRSAAKPQAAAAGARAVTRHLARRRLPAKVIGRGALTCYRVRFEPPDAAVSILIPFRDGIEMTRRCLASLRETTPPGLYEILLLDNGSDTAEAERFCAEQANLSDTRVLRIPGPFNFSRINNIGARAARHPFLLLLNNDVVLRGGGWLETLLSEMADPQVAAVGAKLLYPSGEVQHAGVVLGVGGVADHAFRGLPGDAAGFNVHAIASREVSAVTAACMLLRRDAFDAVGGFDEAEFSIAFNDVDLCLRLRAAGYRIIFAAECIAQHHESSSRGDDLGPERLARFMYENEAMNARWGEMLRNDPFYNWHFSRDGGIYRDLRIIQPEDETPVPGFGSG